MRGDDDDGLFEEQKFPVPFTCLLFIFVIFQIRIANKCRFQIQTAAIQNYFEFNKSAAICKCLIVYFANNMVMFAYRYKIKKFYF